MDASGRILVPGIYDHVAPVTDEERAAYEAIDLDLEEYQRGSRVAKFLFDTKVWPPPAGVGEAGGLPATRPQRLPAVAPCARVSGGKPPLPPRPSSPHGPHPIARQLLVPQPRFSKPESQTQAAPASATEPGPGLPAVYRRGVCSDPRSPAPTCSVFSTEPRPFGAAP